MPEYGCNNPAYTGHCSHECHTCSSHVSSSTNCSNGTCYHPRPGGRVKIEGQIKLTCNYVDHHGHTQTFELEQGKMYMIEAISSTKGLVTFSGKIVDFDSVKGIEKILQAPHTVSVGAIIVDYSTDYESKVIRIGIDNITSIVPMESVENVESTNPNTYFVNDPFAETQLEETIKDAEINADGTVTNCCTDINDPFEGIGG